MTTRFQSAKFAAALVLAGGLAAAPTSLALAAGGGGGGGGSAPSASGPQYDPAEEYREGVAHYNAGNFAQAARHFKKVTRVARRNGEAHYLLGLSYMQAGQTKRARKPLENAVKYSPNRIEAKRDLALTYVELERMDDARDMLAQLTRLSDQCAGSCADSATLAQSLSAVKMAMNGQAQASFGPSSPAFADAKRGDQAYYRAVSAINREDYEAGLYHLREAALTFGPHPDILTYQGFANRKLGQFDTAQSYYDRALAVAPNHLGALEYYGELKVERGDIAGAKANLAKLDGLCDFGCYEAEELRSWIEKAQS